MARFILLYKGPATPPQDVTPEQGEQITQACGVWMGKVGAAVVDLGAPLSDGTATFAIEIFELTPVEM